jgi:hypothetical protein
MLLSLSDDMKLSAINLLSESLLKKKAYTPKVSQPASRKGTTKQSTEEFIESLVLKGGNPVPPSTKGINALLEEKYL